MPDSLDMVLRGGAATTFLLLAVFLLRDGGNRTLGRLGALFAISTGWWALNIPPFVGWTYQFAFPLLVITFGKAAAFWLFTRALYDDEFRLRLLDWAIWGAMVAGGGAWVVLGQRGLSTDWVRIPHQTAQLVLAASAAWIAWKGRDGDLVEARRRSRLAFVLLSALMMVGITVTYMMPGPPTPLVMDLNVIRIFIMAVGMALLVAGLRSREMFGRTAAAIPPPLVRATDGPGSASDLDPGDVRLLARLQRLMEVERAYRQDGLSIGALAAQAGAPEHVLRRLINGRLGQRNFKAYLNGWRLADARAALLDPHQVDVPISTIALDAGFRSLGPFNRAFKAAEQMTPTAFRDRAAAARSPAGLPRVGIVRQGVPVGDGPPLQSVRPQAQVIGGR